MSSHQNAWFVRHKTGSTARARLFCFPYAGGSSITYARWHAGLPPDIEVCAVELPGRGHRMRAVPPLFATAMQPLVGDLASALDRLFDVPCFFFGHSLGAVLAFACARALRRRSARLPEHLFVSARVAPHRPDPDATASAMSDDELVEMLRRGGGTPAEILAEPELMALFLPIIRADYCLLSSYLHTPEPPLDCPITAFAGTHDDRADPDDVADWRIHTSGAFAVERIEGNHFFVNTNRNLVIQRVARTIESSLSRRSVASSA